MAKAAKADEYVPPDNAENIKQREAHMAELGKKPEVSTPFDQPAKKKRYSEALTAIHAIERIMGKLTAHDRMTVYLHIRNGYQPELSFVPLNKEIGS